MKREMVIIFGLIAITLAAFSGLGKCDFINYDDPGYASNNRHVTTGLSATNFVWAWTTFDQGNYLPLTWLSLMLDASLFGRGPHGFHWVNLVFHIANAVLVYWFFRQATGAVWRSALVAAVFAVHPLRVESVAWVVERKDVLTGFFALLAMLAYVHYARSLKWAWYAATLLLFAAALLSKQTLATLPCLLLLLDYWPLGRWMRGPAAVGSVHAPRRSLSQLILEKLPLFVMAAGILVVTMRAQASHHAISDFKSLPLAWRLTNVPVSYARYLGKMIWFHNLAVHYPVQQWSAAQVAGSCALLGIITTLCFWKLRSAPWLLVGWLWFLGVLVPMIGVVQFGPQAMADRFTYIAGIGILVMGAWSIPATASRRPVLVVAGVGTTLGILIICTIGQTRYWQNGISLFSHDIAVAGSSGTAELNLGEALRAHGDVQLAIPHLRTAVAINSRGANARVGLALALSQNHQDDEAVQYAISGVKRDPGNPTWRVDLAYVLMQCKRYGEAVDQCREAVAIDPQYVKGHIQLGIALCEMGKLDEGIGQLKFAVSIAPDLPEARIFLKRYQDSPEKRPPMRPATEVSGPGKPGT